MVALGFLMPWIAARQNTAQNGIAFGRGTWYAFTAIVEVLLLLAVTYGMIHSILPSGMGIGRWIVVVIIDVIIAAVVWGMTRNGRQQIATEL
jgi:hypothetical protein